MPAAVSPSVGSLKTLPQQGSVLNPQQNKGRGSVTACMHHMRAPHACTTCSAMQHVVRCGSIAVAAAVHRYTEHVNDRLLTAACVLQVLLFLQEEEEESSPETQMKTNKGTCGSPLHICSFCFFLSPLSSSSPLLTGVSWYTGFYWSGPSSEESVCCLYQQRSPCVFMAKD